MSQSSKCAPSCEWWWYYWKYREIYFLAFLFLKLACDIPILRAYCPQGVEKNIILNNNESQQQMLWFFEGCYKLEIMKIETIECKLWIEMNKNDRKALDMTHIPMLSYQCQHFSYNGYLCFLREGFFFLSLTIANEKWHSLCLRRNFRVVNL